MFGNGFAISPANTVVNLKQIQQVIQLDKITLCEVALGTVTPVTVVFQDVKATAIKIKTVELDSA